MIGLNCVTNIDPKASAVIIYFKHILENEVEGIYQRQDDAGLQRFTVHLKTKLVKDRHIVEHLLPQVIRNTEGEWGDSVMFHQAETLNVGQTYFQKLKAKYKQGQLTFAAL